jgi:hypothetical protein
MAPQRPGDGIAAGWIKHLELRNDGEELWAEVEFTASAAEKVANQEYRFISPSFVKDHTDTHTGKKIGTTLLAAALTNHPFLQAMNAVALCDDDVVGDVAFSPAVRPPPQKGFAMKIGTHVSFIDDDTKTPELTPKERGDTYVVKTVVDVGDQQFVRLETLDGGTEFGWFDVSQLAPAPAPTKDTIPPAPMTTVKPETPEEAVALAPPIGERRLKPPTNSGYPVRASAVTMSADEATTELLALSQSIAKERKVSLSEAVKLASTEHADLVSLRDGHALSEHRASGLPAGKPAPVVSLSVQDGESFDSLCYRTAKERSVSLAEAIHLCAQQHPDLAAA